MPTLQEIAAEVNACTRCKLARFRTRGVPGDGPEDAEVMLIGEAPGFHEDKQGHPFVGQAGQFLNHLLSLAGLDRGQVFITNIIKSRPPNNRDPEPDEIAACAGYLEAQIERINPKVIVTLGRHSLARYFPGQSIGRVHGTTRPIGGRLVFAMYHPAAALHNQNLRTVLEDDIKKLRPILNELAGRPRPTPASAGTNGQATPAATPQEEPKPNEEPRQLSFF